MLKQPITFWRQFMRNFLNRFYIFMQGRYGKDELNTTLLVTALILIIVSRFVRSWILRILAFLILALLIFRTLSRNIYKRSAENRKFLPVYKAVTGWFKLTYKKFRDGKTHRYYSCPKCKAQLRVKNIKGKHTIKCPKCGAQFQKKIW